MARFDVTIGSLDVGSGEVSASAALLDCRELERASRFRFACDRRRFIVRRARLRQVLSAATGCGPRDLAFTTNAWGKPRLAEGGLHFSASHSAECWVVAVGSRDVGVDCERIDPSIEWRELARTLFGPGEVAALEVQETRSAMRAFFDCWTRKEAFVKALGLGLSHPLESFEVSVTPEPALLAGGEGWAIAPLDAGPDFAAALVVEDAGAPPEVQVHDMSDGWETGL